MTIPTNCRFGALVDNILAFEASDFCLTLALMKEGHVVGEFRAQDFYEQDALLLPEIERMLKQNDLSYDQLDLIATTQGPGSFTGVRVALATAEGLSLASCKPAVAFNVFEWVAKSFTKISEPSEELLLVALESKRKDIYCQLFDRKGAMLKEPVTLLPYELMDYIENKKSLCIGSGCCHLKNSEIQRLIEFPNYIMPSATDLCSYAKQQVFQFGIHAFPCEPSYLRLPDVTFSKT